MHPKPTMLPILFVGCVFYLAPQITGNGEHDIPVVGQTFYDPNYHDDGRNHLRANIHTLTGPTAASSGSTLSVINPYAMASSSSSETYKPNPGPFMTVVDHYYGPNGEEKIQYSNVNSMQKEDLENMLTKMGPTKYQYPQKISPSHKVHSPQTYTGSPLSSLYKPVPSASTGYSLGTLYKSAEISAKSPATYRPAFSTIYKDAAAYVAPPKNFGGSHYKNPIEFVPAKDSVFSPSYSGKEPILLHSPKESHYAKGSNYFVESPKSISDSILADSYGKYTKTIGEEDDSRGNTFYSPAPGYTPGYPSHLNIESGGGVEYSSPYHSGKSYAPSMTVVKDETGYSKGPVKPGMAGLYAYPVKYGSSEHSAPMPMHHHQHSPNHESYSAGFGGGYSLEDSSDPYSRPGGFVKRPPISHSPAHGQSLSSLYEPLTFDDYYTKPKSHGYAPTKSYHPSAGIMSKPSYSPPSPYTMSYGPPVEYHMPPSPHQGYITSSSPYGSGSSVTSKYKGPYRTVTSGPSSYGFGYGFGKPHAGNLFTNYISDMYSWYKTRGNGWARRPPMMKTTPYYKYKYSTISHSNIHKHPFEYENGASEKYYNYRRPNRFSRVPFY